MWGGVGWGASQLRLVGARWSTGAASGNGGGWDALRIAVGSGRDDIVAALQQGQRPTFYEPIV